MQPIVYVTENFLMSYQEKIKIPFVNLQQKEREMLNFIDTLFDRSKLSVNISQHRILEILQSNENLSSLLGKQSKKNSIGTFTNYLETILKNNSSVNIAHPDYFLYATIDNETVISKIKNFGIIAIDDSFDSKLKIFSHHKQPIALNKKFGFTDIKHFFCTGNCVIIEDPYLFKNDKYAEYTIDLLDNLLINSIEKIKFISIFYPKGYKDEIFGLENAIKTRLNIPETEIIFISKDVFHDRHIYTNTLWISCGYGFQKEYEKNTSWDFYPIGLNFSSLERNLKNLINPVSNDDIKKISNPFLKRFITKDKISPRKKLL